MIDRAKIFVKAGDGGDGCNSFKGARFTRSRHPDGGTGGRGADIIIKVDKKIQNLEHFRFKQYFRAEDGKCGQANKKKGADGRPCVIKVPAGTIIRDFKNKLLLRDLVDPSEELVGAKGGRGGKGNTSARVVTRGLLGEQRHLVLELKLVVDIGIVGYPNAGKSTLLTKISSARPKLADYPFTTITPIIGVVEFADFDEPSVLTVVELPGLIKDAHKGKGLGIEFLRHVERAKILIHLIDLADQQRTGPLGDYYSLNQELEFYNSRLANKPQVLVANKIDLPEASTNLKSFSSKINEKIYPISALSGEGIEELLNSLRKYF